MTVFEENHGRSTSDVVRFRNAEGSLGLTSTDLNKSAGFQFMKLMLIIIHLQLLEQQLQVQTLEEEVYRLVR